MMQGHGGAGMSGVKRSRPDQAAHPSNTPYPKPNRRPDGETAMHLWLGILSMVMTLTVTPA